MILRYAWLKDHNLEVNWQTREVQMNWCPPWYEGCCTIQKEQASQKKLETRATNIYWSRPPSEYAEDLEEDETPFQICEVEYRQGDKLFVMRILLESTTEDLQPPLQSPRNSQREFVGPWRLRENLLLCLTALKDLNLCLPKKTSTSSQSIDNGMLLSNLFQVWSLGCWKSTLCLWWNKRSWTPS